MFRRAWLYVSRNWKRSLILVLILTLLLSALIVVPPTCRASEQAQEELAASLGESFHVKWGISQLTHPHLYEEYVGEDGVSVLYRYIGEDYMTQEVLDEILAINGVTGYTESWYWWLYFPDLTLKEGLYSTYYADTPEDDPMYNWRLAGRNTCTVYGINNTQQHKYFDRGSIELVEGRHIKKTDIGCVIISRELAQLNGLSVGDTITGHTLQIILTGVGTTDDRWDAYELEIVGIFDVLGAVDTVTHSTEEAIIENQMFCDITTMRHIQSVVDSKSSTPPPEDQITAELLFFVDDPANLQFVIDQVRGIRLVDMSVFDVGMSNASFAASIQPLRTMRGIMIVFRVIIVIAFVLILRYVLKIWFHDRRKEIGILLACGIKKVKVIAQLVLEMLLILSVAFVGAGIVASVTADALGNTMYALTANDESINDEQYEQATDIGGANYDPFDPFIEIVDYSPVELDIKVTVKDLGYSYLVGALLTTAITVLCCLPIVRRRPRHLLGKV